MHFKKCLSIIAAVIIIPEDDRQRDPDHLQHQRHPLPHLHPHQIHRRRRQGTGIYQNDAARIS